MYELSLQQLEQVTEIVSNSEITYSHLPDDLIDHICCDIESEMSIGLSFNKALERVQCKFGDLGLQKIQEDTILLIDQKYRFMKTTMKIFGNVSLALIGIGTIFKILHWPGASIGLTLGFLLLGLIFYPATIFASYRKNGRKNLFLHIIPMLGGIALMFGILCKIQHWPGASIFLTSGWGILLLIFLPLWLITNIIRSTNKKETLVYTFGVIGVIIFELSTLFKIQHWPGANFMLIIGAVLITSVFLPLYSVNLYKKSDSINGRFIYVIIGISFFLMFGALVSISFEKKVWSSVSYTDYYAQIEKKYFKNQNTNLYKTFGSDESAIGEIHQEAENIGGLIEKIRKDLILKSQNISGSEVEKYLSDISLIKDKGKYNLVNELFFSDQGERYAQQLKQSLLNYESKLLSALEKNTDYKKEIKNLFMLEDHPEDRLITWEDRAFRYNSLYTTLIKLSNIDRNVKLAENIVVNYLMDNKDVN